MAEQGVSGIPDGGEVTTFSIGANVAGWCTDPAMPYDLSASPEVRRARLDAALAEMPDDVFAPWTKQGWEQYWLFGSCVGWPTPSTTQEVVPAGTTMPEVPTLVLSGELDPHAPLSASVIASFPNSALITVPRVGHLTLSRGDCVAEYEAEFLRTLEIPAEGPCADD